MFERPPAGGRRHGISTRGYGTKWPFLAPPAGGASGRKTEMSPFGPPQPRPAPVGPRWPPVALSSRDSGDRAGLRKSSDTTNTRHTSARAASGALGIRSRVRQAAPLGVRPGVRHGEARAGGSRVASVGPAGDGGRVHATDGWRLVVSGDIRTSLPAGCQQVRTVANPGYMKFETISEM